MTLLLLSITLCTSLLLPFMMQPLSLGLVVMVLTLLMCCISSMLLSAWYGYILFLIYVGGLLVMFAYVAALSPNILFGSVMPLLSSLVILVPMGVVMYFYPFIDSSSIMYYNSYSEMKLLKTLGMEMVSPQMISVLIGLGTILLINLIVIVKICYYQAAPLRPFS
uniref:NADH dehydrogenase subunit 6 n=1 Tax=Sydaphera spengleriana TaxID=1088891 RepID=A0A8K1RRW5_9CAEN|nr:NADH dehydrogenase subunit 6 [Sydaphera spengleriana]